MGCVFSAEAAVFLELQFIRGGPLILGRRIVPPFAFRARQRDDALHTASLPDPLFRVAPDLPTQGPH